MKGKAMPNVNGKKFGYDAKGKAAAAKAKALPAKASPKATAARSKAAPLAGHLKGKMPRI